MTSSPTLFVTGTGSFIGGAVLRQAKARGFHLSGCDAGHPGDGFAKADIRDPAITDLIPEGADAIIHLAALSRDPDCRGKAAECFDVNVMGTLNLMEAARKRGVKQFIFASSEWVYTGFKPGVEKTEDDVIDPASHTSEYAFSKVVSEINLRQAFAQGFCAATILRLGIVYGPRPGNWSAVEALVDNVARKDEVVVGSRATARRFIHVDDIAGGILASVGLAGLNVLNIQGPRLVTLGEVIDCAKKILGRDTPVRESAPDAPNLRPVSSAKAEQVLGWKAGTGIEDGVRSVTDFLGLGGKP
jgi:nucleoside-diphosphate-sugar epimerase